ncbi:ROK family protein [Microvirga subterranea]|uniref:Putative NBD/HSP70 family sugar kinase n=1 Tax=Microvirga subterranea TaxID=186651 RepID=A0A370HTA7_9HYPH|nr:ROK family protein [Microvirga subterranea]RDI61763.1 putative NBD/HSP70 family sugar kinase [Microvirga subterranea]
MPRSTPPPPKAAIGNNPERNRSHNRRVVLDAVRLHGPLGRTAIARLAHLTPQAVSNIVSELLDEGLLLECGRLRAGRGLPPVQVAVNPDGGMTIGVEIAADHLVMALVDLTGRVRANRTLPLEDATPDHIAPLLKREIDGICKTASGSHRRLLGLGVVMPGPFDIDGMSSVGPTTLPGWVGEDAAQVLTAATGVSTLVENDATAAAVGERLHGVARKLNNFCLLYFGAGLGLGIVVDGRPMRGAFGNAGEIGHIVVQQDGSRCACGNRGCLERYASLHSLKEKLADAGVSCRTVSDLAALHEAGSAPLKEWIAEAGAHLSPVIAMLENLLDPECIVFSGALPDTLLDDLIASLQPLPLSVASRRKRALPRIIRGTTGLLTAALGAAALPLQETMTPKLDTAPAIEQST